MKTATKSQVLKLLQEQGPAGPSAIALSLQISPQMVHRHLKSLLTSGDIKKQGVPPKVLYFAIDKQPLHQFPALPSGEHEYIDEHYFTVKPDGEVMSGLEGLQWWALKTKQHKNFQALAQECQRVQRNGGRPVLGVHTIGKQGHARAGPHQQRIRLRTFLGSQRILLQRACAGPLELFAGT